MGNIFVPSMEWLIDELRSFAVSGKKRDAFIEDGRQVAKAIVAAGILGVLTGQLQLLSGAWVVLLGVILWAVIARLISEGGLDGDAD